MSILFYSSTAQMAVTDDSESKFLADENVASSAPQGDSEDLAIQDWQTYYVKFYGKVPVDFAEHPFVQHKLPGQLFEILFRNTVGRTRIGPVSVCVTSNKISEELYKKMLSHITVKFSNLVFSFATPLGQNYRKEKPGKDVAYIEYLFLKKYLLDSSPDLNGISALITANPHIRQYRKFRHCSIDMVTNTSPAMLISMFTASDRFASLKSGHTLLETSLGRKISDKTGCYLYPSEAIAEKKYLTVDTNENRFVKHFLQMTLRKLKSLQKKILEQSEKSYLNPDIEKYLKSMIKKIRAFLVDPLWYDVGSMTFIPVSSQVLHRREGYRQLFRLYSLLQLTSKCDFPERVDFRNLLETKDTPTLFEYWSFFVIKDVLEELLSEKSTGRIISDDQFQQEIEEGISIKYKNDTVLLHFNKTYNESPGRQPGDDFPARNTKGDSYSHNFRPDIVIEKKQGKRLSKLLIFDAKFKGKRGGFYGENEDGSVTSWKPEDIDKMHCYREAIQGVAGAYILYPGNTFVIYRAHNANGEYEGVGAFPLKPKEEEAEPVQKHREEIYKIIKKFIE